MNFLIRRKSILYVFLVVFLLPVAALLLYSCSGSSGYSTRSTALLVMITPETLNNWVENGYGTDSNGYNKLVILDVDSASSYTAAHIPKSFNLDTAVDLKSTRSNGLTTTISQVATKAQMDALIQRTGIDEHTVVALVGNGTMMNVGRAYFNFRYWGFPKDRLKVLDGTKTATYQNAAGYSLISDETPLPLASLYSVADLEPDVSVRVSLEEMIGLAQDADPFTVVIDARSADEYNGVVRKTSVTNGPPKTYVAFEGHIKTAEHQEYVTLQIGGNRANPLLPENELIAAMTAINMDEDSTGISYCKTSWRATIQVLALDAVLGWNAKIYDGAWIQWGLMASNDPAVGGPLEPDSPWITEALSQGEADGPITYNRKEVEQINASDVDSFAANANEINEEDKAICGTTPAAPPDRAVEVMVSNATLNGWVTGGYSDPQGHGYTKMVVLHVDFSKGNYDAGHVPGAFFMAHPADLTSTRNNGIADTISQVATMAQMDALIQRTGIGADTVVVVTTSPGGFNMMNLGRAYFNFRYWGFPKERLRILDGNTALYGAEYALSTVTPAPVASIYSVCRLRQVDTVDEVRASYEEMLAVAGDDDASTVVADARSADEYNGVMGKTTVTSSVPTHVAFEGHVRTAEHQEWSTLTSGGRLLPEDELIDAMAAIGASPTTTVYTYCKTSWRAAVNFMALDAALGWPVKIYDGAWIQWGQMASRDPMLLGSLDPDSPWQADNSDGTESLTYNAGPIGPVQTTSSYAPHANLINLEDSNAAAAGGGAGGGPGGSGDKPDAPGYN
jgi:3-mercaptopyruvate sulfurtransferase SseA